VVVEAGSCCMRRTRIEYQASHSGSPYNCQTSPPKELHLMHPLGNLDGFEVCVSGCMGQGGQGLVLPHQMGKIVVDAA